jgi:hypothetical protein
MPPSSAVPTSASHDRIAAMTAFFDRSVAEQKARHKKHNDVTNRRKRELRMAARTPLD